MNYSDSHLDKGEIYDERFNHKPVFDQSRFERNIILEVLRMCKPKKILDFACGTGRILEIVENVVEEEVSIIGMDISPSMLAVAKRRLKRTTIVEGNFRFHPMSFEEVNLVTAFRFFSNAEPSLREEAIRFMKHRMRQEGWLLFNMHNNCKSISNRLLSLKYGKSFGVEEGEFIDFVKNEGFELVQMWSIGLWPQDHRKYYLSSYLGTLLEKINYLLLSEKHHLGSNNLYLFRKS